MKLKRIFSLALGTALALSLVACGSNDNPAADNSKPGAVQPPSNNATIGGDPATWGPDNQPSDNGVQPPSPFQPCDTLDAAEELAGFDLTLPKTADKLEAIENEMIQAFYGEDSNDMLIRKALGNEDISGDYNEYAQTETVDGVTLKGTDGQFSLAMWTDGDYTYSIHVGSALSQTDMMALVSGVK